MPAVVLDHDLAVDQRSARGEMGRCRRYIREFYGPIESLASEQVNRAAVDARLNAIAVELDLVHPAVAGGRGRTQPSQRRRDEIRQWRPVWLGILIVVFAFLRSFFGRPFAPRAA